MPRGKRKFIAIALLSFLIISFNFLKVKAEEEISIDLEILRIDKTTSAKGYTAELFGKNFKLGISPNVLSQETEIIFKDFYKPDQVAPIPENLKPVSHIYEFDITDKALYDNTKPLLVEFHYPSDQNNYKKVYYWDGAKGQWIMLPTQTLTHYGLIRAKINLPYARLGVFEDNIVLTKGTASWYKYRDCDCAASPDYPKGSKLKVTNLDNNKQVIITINDYGPDRTVHPDRVIDLDLVAFKKIAAKSAGLINVKIDPVNDMAVIVAGTEDKAPLTQVDLVENKSCGQPDFKVSADSAIIINAKTNEILWAKNENKISSIASLTKLMTAEIFLQHNPGWSKVINYKESDDDVLNYAKRWEISYLKVTPGELLKTKDLFYSSLIGSANNATYALARSTGLLRRDFVNSMNYQANLWGMTNTCFTEPSGLDPKNVSTAKDLAKLGSQVFKKIDFLQSTTLKQYSFSTINTKKPHTIKNQNQLLASDLYVLGTKTGYLDEAGHCLISKVRHSDDPDKELIIVVLGAKTKSDSANDILNLARWGLKKI